MWEICDDHLFNGSDALKMVETKIIREFDYEGKHYKVFVNPNDRFVKKEKFNKIKENSPASIGSGMNP